MRSVGVIGLALLASACGRGEPGAAAPTAEDLTAAALTAEDLAAEDLAAELAVARAGCVRCHAVPAEWRDRVAPWSGPDLAEAAAWHADDGAGQWMRRHHGGEAAVDLAAYVMATGTAANPTEAELQTETLSPGLIERGQRLFEDLACEACHAPAVLEGLARRTDCAHLVAFLVDPTRHRPGRVHLRLPAQEATAVAAWLLRSQVDAKASQRQPGFAFECFELQVDDKGLPDLMGAKPTASGVVPHIDATVGTRENHFVLQFTSTLEVPATGEWIFTTGSDDSSWLWLDGALLVRNEGLAPHRRQSARLQLTAGPHDLRVVYTQAAGQHSLEVLWQGPGVAEQLLPAAQANAALARFVPPTPPTAAEPAAIERGRLAAAERRCGACHTLAGAPLPAPSTPPARPWSELRGGECPAVPGAEGLWSAAQRALPAAPSPANALDLALLRDGCLQCHARDGRGGLPPAVRQNLREVEDLGDEGRLPPDLTAVGRRLRPAWLEKVLAEGHSARPYLRVRMPVLGAELAHRYATWFAAVDGQPGADEEAPFSVEAAQRGRQLVGLGGRNCIACHSFAGRKALGPQGMDLAIQAQRLRPAWFRHWLLQPTALRPGTRMPALWPRGDDADRQEIEAIAAWASLGDAAPLPPGLVLPPGSWLLEPNDRPRLHGAFLKGLSARCVAVGTVERAHYAYDLAHARLAWLWRGAFLDAEGTWSGRAGKLLEPLGTDWVVLEDLDLASEPAAGPSEAASREMLGRRFDAAGYPIWRVRVGTAEFEDELRPRLAPGGSEFVRTLRVLKGTLQVQIPATSGKVRLALTGKPGKLEPGQSLEIVYQW